VWKKLVETIKESLSEVLVVADMMREKKFLQAGLTKETSAM